MYNYITIVGSTTQAEQEGHSENSLAFNPYNFGFSIINIIILFLLLKWILFKPISKMMNERSEKIKKSIQTAENNKVETEKFKNEHKEQLDKIKEEVNNIISNAKQKAQIEAEAIIKKAKEDAEVIIARSREQGQREIDSAMEHAKNDIVNLALEAASKVVQKNMDNETNRKLVEEFINEVGAA